MYTIGLAEHGSECERESDSEQPNSHDTNMLKERLGYEALVLAQEINARIGQHAANNDQVVQVRTGHLDESMLPEANVEEEKQQTDTDTNSGQH
jgi:hypothetical protein